MSKSTPRIAIIGAGPAGLTLARILQVNNIPATIYDGDGSASERNQGGTLDLKSGPGQEALHKAKLFDEWLALTRPEGQADKIADKNFHLHFHHIPGAEENDNPEIDRGQLRDLLANSLDEAHAVRWGHKLKDVHQATPNGEFTLTFTNDKTVTADFVVGADGAWSRIRQLVTKAKPVYSGVTFADLTITSEILGKHPELTETIGDGSLFALDDNKGMITQRTSTEARVYAGNRVEEGWHKEKEITSLSKKELRDYILANWFQDWHPKLRALVENADDSHTVIRVIYALPVEQIPWKHRKGVTLIGDAAHVMSPFAGEGVNLALGDASGLAQAIIQAVEGGDFDEEVQKMEEDMWKRAHEAGTESADNTRIFFDNDAAKTVGGMFAKHAERRAARGEQHQD